MKLRDLTEQAKHYKVKHKQTGKEYKVTALSDNSAKVKARVKHGGTASRYTGVSLSDFEIVENYNKKSGNPLKAHGLKAYKYTQDGKDYYISVQHDKETGRFNSLQDLKNHQTDLINKVDENMKGLAGAGATAVLIGLLGLGNISSAKQSPLGKELQMAAQQGDTVAAYHLKNLDFYADQGMSRTLQNLKIAYIDDANRQDVEAFLSDPKRFPGIKPKNESITEEQFDEAAGEKDACYHKVKSRYKVWPSAYASGALVKCRKVGAKNWGNSKKK